MGNLENMKTLWPLHRARCDELLKQDNDGCCTLSADAVSRGSFAILWASFGNSILAVFWSILNLLCDEAAYLACQNEVYALVKEENVIELPMESLFARPFNWHVPNNLNEERKNY